MRSARYLRRSLIQAGRSDSVQRRTITGRWAPKPNRNPQQCSVKAAEQVAVQGCVVRESGKSIEDAGMIGAPDTTRNAGWLLKG